MVSRRPGRIVASRPVGIPRPRTIETTFEPAFVDAGNRGIGYLMLSATSSFRVPLVFAGLIVVAVMGVGMYAVFAVLERRFAGWAFRDDVPVA